MTVGSTPCKIVKSDNYKSAVNGARKEQEMSHNRVSQRLVDKTRKKHLQKIFSSGNS